MPPERSGGPAFPLYPVALRRFLMTTLRTTPSNDPLLVILLGPTGSGKTTLSVALAQRFGGEILSCDSVAVYRGMELGTAKPTPEERAKAPHHLIDLLDPSEAMTAGDWARRARRVASEIAARHRLPIVAGGTGLYLRAFTEGLAPLPPRCPAVRSRLLSAARPRPGGYLPRMLRRLDSAAARRIHANDEPKLIRALEIALLGPAPTAPARDPLRGFRLLRIGLNPDRRALYDRLDRRAAAMFANGLTEETRKLQQTYGAGAQALNALGYREAAAVLAGSLSEREAIAAAQQGHRNYAKRQMTWFRREPAVVWLAGFGDAPEIREAALLLVANQQLREPGDAPRLDSSEVSAQPG